LPRVKVAVESSVGDHGRGNIGKGAGRDGHHLGSPRVSQVTPGLCWWLICAGGCWAEPTSCHAQWLVQLLRHIVFINPLITSSLPFPNSSQGPRIC
jgi:hypothetical protein